MLPVMLVVYARRKVNDPPPFDPNVLACDPFDGLWSAVQMWCRYCMRINNAATVGVDDSHPDTEGYTQRQREYLVELWREFEPSFFSNQERERVTDALVEMLGTYPKRPPQTVPWYDEWKVVTRETCKLMLDWGSFGTFLSFAPLEMPRFMKDVYLRHLSERKQTKVYRRYRLGMRIERSVRYGLLPKLRNATTRFQIAKAWKPIERLVLTLKYDDFNLEILAPGGAEFLNSLWRDVHVAYNAKRLAWAQAAADSWAEATIAQNGGNPPGYESPDRERTP
jgi:hypothetical protein